jgi:Ran GTPase-activating protein (RanGAP) involved in mRNA processing and transport
LFENDVGEVGAKCVSELILKSQSLRMLNLYECGLSDACMVDIAWALSQLHSLAAIHLARNKIGDSGAASLARAIAEDSSSLGFISLARNYIRDTGLKILAEALEHNFHLQTFNVEGNKGHKAGAAVYTIDRLVEANIARAKARNVAKKRSDAHEL